MCILHIVFCTVCKYVLSICKLLSVFCNVCPYVNGCFFIKYQVDVIINQLALCFLEDFKVIKHVVWKHVCINYCEYLIHKMYNYAVCLKRVHLVIFIFIITLLFIYYESTLIRISLTKALVLWWCDNKSDLIWFDLIWYIIHWLDTQSILKNILCSQKHLS